MHLSMPDLFMIQWTWAHILTTGYTPHEFLLLATSGLGHGKQTLEKQATRPDPSQLPHGHHALGGGWATQHTSGGINGGPGFLLLPLYPLLDRAAAAAPSLPPTGPGCCCCSPPTPYWTGLLLLLPPHPLLDRAAAAAPPLPPIGPGCCCCSPPTPYWTGLLRRPSH